MPAHLAAHLCISDFAEHLAPPSAANAAAAGNASVAAVRAAIRKREEDDFMNFSVIWNGQKQIEDSFSIEETRRRIFSPSIIACQLVGIGCRFLQSQK
ncbi:MAG: hypothetical protein AB7F79_12815 [Steroidobacteraceae bacterium]